MSLRKCKSCAKFFSIKLDDCPECGAKYERHLSQTSRHKDRIPSVACDFCITEAICKARMNSGFVNLCEPHYKTYWTPEHIAENLTAPSTSSDFVRSVRTAYEKSVAFASIQRGHISEALREPGEEG